MAQSFFAKDGTAQGVAKQRYIETLAKSEVRLINDPYSKNFVIGSGIMKLMGHKLNSWLTQKIAPGFHEHLISRTRFVDELVEKCYFRRGIRFTSPQIGSFTFNKNF